MFFFLSQRPASPKPARHAPAAPRPAPIAPQSSQPMQPQQPPPQQVQSTPIVSQSNGNFNFSVNPSQMASAFSAATSLMNNFTLVKNKLDPPNRPTPTPGNNGLPNPLVPQ